MIYKEKLNKIKLKCKGKVGWICGAFDLIHTGHILALQDSKAHCDTLVVGLHSDPSIDRPEKNKPILSLEERKIILNSIKYIDYFIEYDTEEDLYLILKELDPDIRILGTDYIGKSFTGDDLPIEIYYHNRNHDYSSTNIRERVKNA